MSGHVAGKVAVVTGAGQGQGAAEARLLAAEGATVLALDLGETPGEDLPGVEHRRLDVTGDATLLGPVGVMGNSFGGLFAALLAAQDSRVAACVVNGAPPAPAVPELRTAREQMDAAFGTRDGDTLAATLRQLRFDPSRQPIGCPVLVLHGGADPLVDRGQAQAFAGASARGRLESWPDGEHTIYNHADERDALVGDWLAEVLSLERGGS